MIGMLQRLLDLQRQALNRMVHAGERRKRDQARVVRPDRADQIRSVGDEQQIGLVPVGLQDAGEVGDADGFLNAVVLDEEDSHRAPSLHVQ